jgi:hypothetical protein
MLLVTRRHTSFASVSMWVGIFGTADERDRFGDRGLRGQRLNGGDGHGRDPPVTGFAIQATSAA